MSKERFAQIGPREHVISLDVKIPELRASNTYGLTLDRTFEVEGYKTRLSLVDNFEYTPNMVALEILEPTRDLLDFLEHASNGIVELFKSAPEELALTMLKYKFEKDYLMSLDRSWVGAIAAANAPPIYNMKRHDDIDLDYIDGYGYLVDSNLYTVKNGYIYFKDSLSNILFPNGNFPFTDSDADPYMFYRVNIKVPTVIPYESRAIFSLPGGTAIPNYGGPIYAPLNTLDTTTNGLAQLALSQTISYLISDYFNVYTMAASKAYGKVEVDYIIQTTAWSTLISSLILVPITLGASAAAGAFQGLAG
ncbi:hypothetical protein LCGC14_1553070, partial [marine sediment metagenome]